MVGGHRLGTAGDPGSILGRSHVQHHIGCGESGFQLRRSSVGILRKITQTIGVRLAVPLGGQGGLVLGHQQFQCLQGSIADGIRYRAFDTALLDANIHDLACVVRQGQVAVGLHDQQGRHGQACRPMACQLFKYFRHRQVPPCFCALIFFLHGVVFCFNCIQQHTAQGVHLIDLFRCHPCHDAAKVGVQCRLALQARLLALWGDAHESFAPVVGISFPHDAAILFHHAQPAGNGRHRLPHSTGHLGNINCTLYAALLD